MAFQAPRSIEEMLTAIHKREYLMPAIQREFVWGADQITKLEPGLFRTVTGLTVEDFHLLVNLGVFNATHMNQAVFAFRRYEDSSLSYTGIESHKGLRRYGLYDTVVAVNDETVV